jgi:hypothetical protein
MANLADIATELYSLVPPEFTAARDAAARAARSDGDSELAAQLKALRRPPISAWLVNELVRKQGDELDALLDLGAELREAQQALDADELRTMTRRRQEVIRGLTELADAIAADAGQQVSDAARHEVEATLDAALADADAADAVRTGRLMRALSSTGLEAVDLDGAAAVPDAAPPQRRWAAKRATKARTKAPPDRGTSRRARDKAVAEARRALDTAEQELAQRTDELAAARSAVEKIRTRISELQTALDEAAAQRSDAEQARRDADAARKRAVRERDVAKRAFDKAQR